MEKMLKLDSFLRESARMGPTNLGMFFPRQFLFILMGLSLHYQSLCLVYSSKIGHSRMEQR